MRQRRAVCSVVVCALLCVFCTSGCASSTTGRPSSPAPATPVGRLGPFLPAGHPDDMIASDAAIWLLDSSEQGKLFRFDPTSKQDIASIPVGLDSSSGREHLAVADDAVWVAFPAEGILMRIDPHSDLVVATLHFAPDRLGPIAASPGALWVANTTANRLTRLDPTTGKVVATIPVPNMPESVTTGAGSVWTCSTDGGARGLTQVDPQTNQVVAQTDVGSSQGYECEWVQFQSGALWVVAFDTHTQQADILERIDPATNRVLATVHLQGDIQTPLAIGPHDVWACNGDSSVSRIDAQTATVQGSLKFTGCQAALLSSGAVWLVVGVSGTLVPVAPAP